MREPTPEEQRRMILGGFQTLEEFEDWLRTPIDPAVLAKLDEPDWEEEVKEEMHFYDEENRDFGELEAEDA